MFLITNNVTKHENITSFVVVIESKECVGKNINISNVIIFK